MGLVEANSIDGLRVVLYRKGLNDIELSACN